MKKSLPSVYLDAHVRNVTPLCLVRDRLGVGLDIPGQPTVRVAITVEDARFICAALDDYINAAAGNHQPMSGLMSSSSSAVPSEGE